MIPNERTIVNALTPQQRRVWQRLSNPPAEAVTPDGYIRTDWLARTWGDILPGSPTLIQVTVHHMNKRLAAYGLRVRGRKRHGGYRLEQEAQ